MRSDLGGRLGVAFFILALLVSVSILTNARRPLGEKSPQVKDFSLAKRVMNTQKCGSCHTLQRQGLDWKATIGPDLTNQFLRQRSPAWLEQRLKSPASIFEDELDDQYKSQKGIMPAFTHLSDKELEAIVDFLMTVHE